MRESELSTVVIIISHSRGCSSWLSRKREHEKEEEIKIHHKKLRYISRRVKSQLEIKIHIIHIIHWEKKMFSIWIFLHIIDIHRLQFHFEKGISAYEMNVNEPGRVEWDKIKIKNWNQVHRIRPLLPFATTSSFNAWLRLSFLFNFLIFILQINIRVRNLLFLSLSLSS